MQQPALRAAADAERKAANLTTREGLK